MNSDINAVKPSSLSHIIGQGSVVDQLTVALDACFADGRRLDDCLLVGGPGLGKSQIAAVVANELATEFHETLGQSFKTPADLNAVLLAATDKSVVHIDEAHEMDKKFQTALYLALDKRMIFLNGGKGIQAIPIADFTLLLSSTDEHRILQPLRDRMKLLLRFQFYSDDELARLLMYRIRGLQWNVHEELLPLIAQRSRGTPRLALRLLQACRRVCRADGETTITTEHLQRACELEQIDALGLGPVEQRYLHILGEGASRLNVLASMIGLPARTVSTVVEPFLMRAGLLAKDDQGRRQLTQSGREHLSDLCNLRVKKASK